MKRKTKEEILAVIIFTAFAWANYELYEKDMAWKAVAMINIIVYFISYGVYRLFIGKPGQDK